MFFKISQLTLNDKKIWLLEIILSAAGSGSGSRRQIKCGSMRDPDPKHCRY